MSKNEDRIIVEESMLDNRDTGTTWINLPSGQVLEINPWDLVRNVIDNLPGGHQKVAIESQFEELCQMVDTYMDEVMKE